MAKVTKINAVEYVTENGYPEVGFFATDKDIKKFYKQLPTDVLLEWVELEGLEYKPCPENEAINRMRIAMAILHKHFPPVVKAKKESKYKAYTLEQLLQMCVDHSVPVEATDSEQIMRMRAIMALRAAGHLA